MKKKTVLCQATFSNYLRTLQGTSAAFHSPGNCCDRLLIYCSKNHRPCHLLRRSEWPEGDPCITPVQRHFSTKDFGVTKRKNSKQIKEYLVYTST